MLRELLETSGHLYRQADIEVASSSVLIDFRLNYWKS